MNLNENPFTGSRVVPYGRTDRQTRNEGDSCLPELCERVWIYNVFGYRIMTYCSPWLWEEGTRIEDLQPSWQIRTVIRNTKVERGCLGTACAAGKGGWWQPFAICTVRSCFVFVVRIVWHMMRGARHVARMVEWVGIRSAYWICGLQTGGEVAGPIGQTRLEGAHPRMSIKGAIMNLHSGQRDRSQRDRPIEPCGVYCGHRMIDWLTDWLLADKAFRCWHRRHPQCPLSRFWFLRDFEKLRRWYRCSSALLRGVYR